MIDFESAYDFDKALKLGELTDSELFVSYEGLIYDMLLNEYAELRSALAMSIKRPKSGVRMLLVEA